MCFEKHYCRIHLIQQATRTPPPQCSNVCSLALLLRLRECCLTSISTSSLPCACGLVRSSSRLLLRASTQGAADGAVILVFASMARPGRSGEALGLVRLVRLRTALLGRLQPRCLTTSFVHPIPCLHVPRMARAVRTIRKRIPIQREALHTQTEPAPVPCQATQ